MGNLASSHRRCRRILISRHDPTLLCTQLDVRRNTRNLDSTAIGSTGTSITGPILTAGTRSTAPGIIAPDPNIDPAPGNLPAA
ncbi:hypothetical protein SAMN06295879_1067 [Agreia bicolorata]|uniref:Uncharacterized protein n=1 Tax=Agreia bicolorata TaxID=110935 RepID=A0A1T4XD10_9MICO|nr:hypothetical protein [Agreia bicolorata]KJC65606.1 hypothetical protein TZ00_01965 [Agreia bicolorata]SKA87339.1 hypothetical protein SAMN06295879_1067 [Agreia bicolorata]